MVTNIKVGAVRLVNTIQRGGPSQGRGRAHCVQSCDVKDNGNASQRRRRYRRMTARVVCLVIAAAMLLALVIPAIYAGL